MSKVTTLSKEDVRAKAIQTVLKRSTRFRKPPYAITAPQFWSSVEDAELTGWQMRKVATQIEKKKIRRKGVHAKSKTSKLKSSKNYKKLNRGQGC